MLRFEGTGRRSVKALGPVAVCRREWSAIKCEVRDDFKGKGRGEGGERGFVVDVVKELRNSGAAESETSQACEGGSVRREGTGNLRLGQEMA